MAFLGSTGFCLAWVEHFSSLCKAWEQENSEPQPITGSVFTVISKARVGTGVLLLHVPELQACSSSEASKSDNPCSSFTS